MALTTNTLESRDNDFYSCNSSQNLAHGCIGNDFLSFFAARTSFRRVGDLLVLLQSDVVVNILLLQKKKLHEPAFQP